MSILTKSFGYPNIGANRELKQTLESYWAGKISKDAFYKQSEEINASRLQKQKSVGIDCISSNDFSLYDFILDLSVMFGVIPDRFADLTDSTSVYFSMARGNANAPACEMTKWFDTNYHYIVPEISGNFVLKKNRPLESYKWAKEKLGIETTPRVTGPFTFLKIAKGYDKKDFETLLFELANLYNSVLKELQQNGVKTVQIDEPSLVLDLADAEVESLLKAYDVLVKDIGLDIQLQTYYESLSHYETIVNKLPVNAIGLDFVVNQENLQNIRKFGFPKNKKLIAGVVSGRDIWKTDYKAAVGLIKELQNCTGDLVISNSAPLSLLPVSLEKEKDTMDKNLISLLSFADERLAELNLLKSIINENSDVPVQDFDVVKEKFKNKYVQRAVSEIDEKDRGGLVGFKCRREKQQAKLNLPLLPTTTIGSFPQTP